MSNLDAVGWFAFGMFFGAFVCSLVLHRWALRMMRKSIKVYHESMDLMDSTTALVEEDSPPRVPV